MIKISIVFTSLAICGALTIFETSCANNDNNTPPSGGNGGSVSASGGTSGTNPGAGGSGSGAGGSGSSAGGSSGTAGGGDTVTFSKGKASGPMSGFGWVALGVDDSLTSPVCDSTGATPPGTATDPITNAKPCPEVGGKAVWNSDTALCISGSAPEVQTPAGATAPDYTSYWGLQIGVNSTDPAGDVIATTYSTITFNFDGLPTPAGCVIRAEIHKKGDDPGTTYCATATSGTPIPLSTFSKTCWDGLAGSFITDGGPANIDKVGLQVSGDISNTYTVTDLCLHSIAFGK